MAFRRHTSSRRSRRIVRLLRVIAAVIILTPALLVTLGFVLTRPAVLRRLLVPRIAAALKTPVIIGDIRVAPFSAVVLRGVRIGPADTPFLRVQSLICRYQVFPLLRRRLNITELRIDSPEITVTRDSQGRWRMPAGIQGRREAAGGAEAPRSPAPPAFVIHLRNVRIAGGALRVADRTEARSRLYVHDFRFSVPDVVLGKSGAFTATVSGKAEGERGDSWRLKQGSFAGRFTVVLTRELTLRQVRADVEASAVEAGFAGSVVSQAACRAEVRIERGQGKGEWRFDAFSIEAEEGNRQMLRVEGGGTISASGGTIHLRGACPDVSRFQRFFPRSGVAPGGGRLSLTLDAEATREFGAWKAAGSVGVEEGRVTFSTAGGNGSVEADVRADFATSLDVRKSQVRVDRLDVGVRQNGRETFHARTLSPLLFRWKTKTLASAGADGKRTGVELLFDGFPAGRLVGIGVGRTFLPPELDASAALCSGKIVAEFADPCSSTTVAGRVRLENVCLKERGNRRRDSGPAIDKTPHSAAEAKDDRILAGTLEFSGTLNGFRRLRLKKFEVLAEEDAGGPIVTVNGAADAVLPTGPARIRLDAFSLNAAGVSRAVGAWGIALPLAGGTIAGRADLAVVPKEDEGVGATLGLEARGIDLRVTKRGGEAMALPLLAVSCRAGFRNAVWNVESLAVKAGSPRAPLVEALASGEFFGGSSAGQKDVPGAGRVEAVHAELHVRRLDPSGILPWLDRLVGPGVSSRRIRGVGLREVLDALDVGKRQLDVVLDGERSPAGSAHGNVPRFFWSVRRLLLRLDDRDTGGSVPAGGLPAALAVVASGEDGIDGGSWEVRAELRDRGLIRLLRRLGGADGLPITGPERLEAGANVVTGRGFRSIRRFTLHVALDGVHVPDAATGAKPSRPSDAGATESSVPDTIRRRLTVKIEGEHIGTGLTEGVWRIPAIELTVRPGGGKDESARFHAGGEISPAAGTGTGNAEADIRDPGLLRLLIGAAGIPPEIVWKEGARIRWRTQVAATDHWSRIRSSGRLNAGGIAWTPESGAPGTSAALTSEYAVDVDWPRGLLNVTRLDLRLLHQDRRVLGVRLSAPVRVVWGRAEEGLSEGESPVSESRLEVVAEGLPLGPLSAVLRVPDSVDVSRAVVNGSGAVRVSDLGRRMDLSGHFACRDWRVRNTTTIPVQGPLGLDLDFRGRVSGWRRITVDEATVAVRQVRPATTVPGAQEPAPILRLDGSGMWDVGARRGRARIGFEAALTGPPVPAPETQAPPASEGGGSGSTLLFAARGSVDVGSEAGESSGEQKEGKYTATVLLEALDWREIHVRDGRAGLEFQPSLLHCPELNCTVNGAALQLRKVDVALIPPYLWTGVLRIEGLPLAPVAEAFAGDAQGFAGTLSHLTLSGRGEIGTTERTIVSLDAEAAGDLLNVVVPADPTYLARHPVARLLVLPFDIVNDIAKRTGLGRMTRGIRRLAGRAGKTIGRKRAVNFRNGRFELKQHGGVLEISRFNLDNPLLPGLTFSGGIDFTKGTYRPLDPVLRLRIGFQVGHLPVTVPVGGTLRRPRPAMERFVGDFVRNVGNAAYDTAASGVRQGLRLNPFRWLPRLFRRHRSGAGNVKSGKDGDSTVKESTE